MNVLVINGPNINLLGIREPKIYGKKTYDELVDFINQSACEAGINVDIFQSNCEGEIINKIQSSAGVYDGMIINAAGYAHTSVAIHDAIKAVGVLCVGVHLTDPDKREAFRHIDIVGMACSSVIKGEGFDSYKKALILLKNNIKGSA